MQGLACIPSTTANSTETIYSTKYKLSRYFLPAAINYVADGAAHLALQTRKQSQMFSVDDDKNGFPVAWADGAERLAGHSGWVEMGMRPTNELIALVGNGPERVAMSQA